MPHIRMEKVFERERKGKEGGRAGATRERRPPSFVVACSLAPLEKAAIMKTDVHVTALHHRSGSDNGTDGRGGGTDGGEPVRA